MSSAINSVWIMSANDKFVRNSYKNSITDKERFSPCGHPGKKVRVEYILTKNKMRKTAGFKWNFFISLSKIIKRSKED